MPNNDPRIAFLERMKEVQRMQYDYFKTLITLSTGSILILIAFIEKIFTNLSLAGNVLVIIALFGFSGCIVSCLFVLPSIANMILYINGLQGAVGHGDQIKEDEMQSKISKALDNIKCLGRYTIVFYTAGISLLLLATIINFFA